MFKLQINKTGLLLYLLEKYVLNKQRKKSRNQKLNSNNANNIKNTRK